MSFYLPEAISSWRWYLNRVVGGATNVHWTPARSQDRQGRRPARTQAVFLSGSDHKVAAFWSDEVGFQCPTWQCGGTRVCNRVTVMTGS